jgi:hypothetical protein
MSKEDRNRFFSQGSFNAFLEENKKKEKNRGKAKQEDKKRRKRRY